MKALGTREKRGKYQGVDDEAAVRISLRKLADVSSKEIRQLSQEWGVKSVVDLDDSARMAVETLLALAPTPEIGEPTAGQVLDIFVVSRPRGGIVDVHLGILGATFPWRPSVVVLARLSSLTEPGILASWKVKTKLSWGHFLTRCFTWSSFLKRGFRLNRHEMQILLNQTCLKLAAKMDRSR